METNSLSGFFFFSIWCEQAFVVLLWSKKGPDFASSNRIYLDSGIFGVSTTYFGKILIFYFLLTDSSGMSIGKSSANFSTYGSAVENRISSSEFFSMTDISILGE